MTSGGGQAICGTQQVPLRAAAFRPWLGSRAVVAQDPAAAWGHAYPRRL